jgi:hypothetical protein
MSDWDDFNDGFEEWDEGSSGHELEVLGATGTPYPVLHQKEVDYWNDVVHRYTEDYRFTNISDLQDLDRVLSMELLAYRYQQWVVLERDYDGQSVDVEELNKNVREISKEIRLVKASLGMDKKSRDKDKGESTAAYIENLRNRAREFGIKRNNEAVMAVTLFNELKGLITFHDNCLPDEKKENHIEDADVIEWVRKAIPRFDAIDESFRDDGEGHGQKYWITSL